MKRTVRAGSSATVLMQGGDHPCQAQVQRPTRSDCSLSPLFLPGGGHPCQPGGAQQCDAISQATHIMSKDQPHLTHPCREAAIRAKLEERKRLEREKKRFALRLEGSAAAERPPKVRIMFPSFVKQADCMYLLRGQN